MVRHRPGPYLDTVELAKGFRVVNGRRVHLDELYANEYVKLREFIKKVPYTDSKEQTDILLMGKEKYTSIEWAMSTSIRMARIAMAEFAKLNKKGVASKLKNVVRNNKQKKLDKASMCEVYLEYEDKLEGIVRRWKESFQTAQQHDASKVGVTAEQFEKLLLSFSEGKLNADIDSFLPDPGRAI